jgi:hypothetical protein
VISRPTIKLSWDELDELGCVDHGAPDWNSMTVAGPTKVRDARGNVTLQWCVTVHCQPATPATPLPGPGVPSIAQLDPVEPPPTVDAAA